MSCGGCFVSLTIALGCATTHRNANRAQALAHVERSQKLTQDTKGGARGGGPRTPAEAGAYRRGLDTLSVCSASCRVASL